MPKRIHTGPEPQTIERRAVTVDPAAEGTRLDAWLARQLADMSRAQVQRLIAGGQVAVSGAAIVEGRRKVKTGETYEVAVPEPVADSALGEDIPLAIVHEDDDVIVIDKPAGLVVHPSGGHATGTLVNALIAHCGQSLSGIGGVKRPGIVHRLDKDTSGLLVVAKNDMAHQNLAAQFKSHGADGRLQRAYLALCWGVPDRVQGTIDAPLGRSSHNRTRIAIQRGDAGRHAVTHYAVLERFDQGGRKDVAALLDVELETGRTHQIRVHLAHTGHPILGDQVYGAGFRTRAATLSETARQALDSLGRQALHAARLGFTHPRSGRQMLFESPLPQAIQTLRQALRGASPDPARAGQGKSSKLKIKQKK